VRSPPAVVATVLQSFGVGGAFHVGGNGFKIGRGPNFVLFVLHKTVFNVMEFEVEYNPLIHCV